MKHIKKDNIAVVMLTEEELDIINAALKNRMVYLQGKEKEEENKYWASIEWIRCLCLQCDFINIK